MKRNLFLAALILAAFLTTTCNNPFWPALDKAAELEIISSVNVVGVNAPALGATPNTSARSFVPYISIIDAYWRNSPPVFLQYTSYTFFVTVKAADGYTFAKTLNTSYINGYIAAVTDNTGDTATLSCTFPATLGKEVIDIEVKTQPTNLIYTYGDILDMAGLEITVTYIDDETENVAPEDFNRRGITTAPGDYEYLTVSEYNGKPIKILCGEVTASTENLMVNPIVLALSVTYPDRTIFTPLPGEDSAAVTVDVTGLINGDTLSLNAAGFTLLDTTLTYNGTTAFPSPASNTINLSSANPNYTAAAALSGITVYDGQVNYTGSGNDRRIPVMQTNTAAFNTYANTTNGRTRHYKLIQNILLTTPAAGESNWTAISSFEGSFNGQGYTISNLTINSTANYQGMFGTINSAGIVQNVGLVGGSVIGNGYIGGIAGSNSGIVTNCYATGSASAAASSRVGGIVGSNSGTVTNCYAAGDVSAADNSGSAGGIVGSNSSSGTVTNCCTTGNISATGSSGSAGGIAGSNGGTVTNCYTTGSASVTDTYGEAGGIVGYNNSSGTVENCYAAGNISATGSSGRAGGIVGPNYGTVENCYATGNVSATGSSGRAGGIVSSNYGTVVRNVALNSSVTCSSSGTNYIGRVVGGYNSSSGTLTNYARNTMTIRYNWNGSTGTDKSISAGLTTIDGATITATNWNNATWWQNIALFPSSAWEFRAGPPTLKNMPGNPPQNPTVQ